MLVPEIRYVVGIDVAEWSHTVCALDAQTGKMQLRPRIIAATAAGYVELCTLLVIQERGFSRLKTRNLHIHPLYLSDERRIAGLTWLLCLALCVLILTEYRLRTALQQRGEALVGLNPASPSQRTRRPTAERVIAAFQHLTRTVLALPDAVHHHLTPLTPTQEHVLALLQLPADLYARLAAPAPKPLTHLRE